MFKDFKEIEEDQINRMAFLPSTRGKIIRIIPHPHFKQICTEQHARITVHSYGMTIAYGLSHQTKGSHPQKQKITKGYSKIPVHASFLVDSMHLRTRFLIPVPNKRASDKLLIRGCSLFLPEGGW